MAIHFILIIGRADSTINYKNAVSGAGYIPVVTDSTELLAKHRQKRTNSTLKGMQLINAGLGGTLIQDMGKTGNNTHACIKGRDNRHGCTYTPLEKFEIFPSLSLLKQLYTSVAPPTLINSAHHQCVDELAPGLIAFSHADDGTIEGFIHRFLPIIGLQWHPERLFYSEGSYLKPFLRGLADARILE